MSRNNDYKTGNLLDYLYHQNYYKLIDSSKGKSKHFFRFTNYMNNINNGTLENIKFIE